MRNFAKVFEVALHISIFHHVSSEIVNKKDGFVADRPTKPNFIWDNLDVDGHIDFSSTFNGLDPCFFSVKYLVIVFHLRFSIYLSCVYAKRENMFSTIFWIYHNFFGFLGICVRTVTRSWWSWCQLSDFAHRNKCYWKLQINPIHISGRRLQTIASEYFQKLFIFLLLNPKPAHISLFDRRWFRFEMIVNGKASGYNIWFTAKTSSPYP